MITRISITNFKAFKEAEINVNRLNLFTGLNGMGKSTFIQSLLLLRQSELEGVTLLAGLRLKGKLIDIGKGKDALSINASSDCITFEVDEDYQNIINMSYHYIAETDILLPVEGKMLFHVLGDTMSLVSEKFTYLKAERIAPDHNYRANLSDVKQDGFLGYRGENVALYIALKKFDPLRIDELRHENAKTSNLIDNLDAWLDEITPGAHVISTYYNELDVVKMGFQFDTASDVTPEFSPVNVGFGFTYILPVLVAILSAEKDDLLIIENPESHLHPHGQAKLGELLAKAASAGAQIIIESHSDHLFNGIRVAVKKGLIKKDHVSVFYFERDPISLEHVTTIEQPVIENDGRISHMPKGFFDEYSRQLDSLIR